MLHNKCLQKLLKYLATIRFKQKKNLTGRTSMNHLGNIIIVTRPRKHLWPDARYIHQKRMTNIAFENFHFWQIQGGGQNAKNSPVFTTHKGVFLSTQGVPKFACNHSLCVTVFEVSNFFHFCQNSNGG